MCLQLRIAALVGALVLSASAGPVLADDRAPTRDARTITLDLATQGMAEVREQFRIQVRSPGGFKGLTAVLQMKTPKGFETRQRLNLDRHGRTGGSVNNKRPGERTYRAVLQSARGRFIAASAPVTITWSPLRHAVSLECTRTTAPLRADVPCTATVTPALRLDRMIVSLQVRGRTDWVLVEAARVSQRGTTSIPVNGLDVGESSYRALLLRDARILAESQIVTISFTESAMAR